MYIPFSFKLCQGSWQCPQDVRHVSRNHHFSAPCRCKASGAVGHQSRVFRPWADTFESEPNLKHQNSFRIWESSLSGNAMSTSNLPRLQPYTYLMSATSLPQKLFRSILGEQLTQRLLVAVWYINVPSRARRIIALRSMSVPETQQPRCSATSRAPKTATRSYSRCLNNEQSDASIYLYQILQIHLRITWVIISRYI